MTLHIYWIFYLLISSTHTLKETHLGDIFIYLPLTWEIYSDKQNTNNDYGNPFSLDFICFITLITDKYDRERDYVDRNICHYFTVNVFLKTYLL